MVYLQSLFKTWQLKIFKPISKNLRQKYRKPQDEVLSEARKVKNIDFGLNGFRNKKLQF